MNVLNCGLIEDIIRNDIDVIITGTPIIQINGRLQECKLSHFKDIDNFIQYLKDNNINAIYVYLILSGVEYKAYMENICETEFVYMDNIFRGLYIQYQKLI